MTTLKTLFCGVSCFFCMYSIQAQNERSADKQSVTVSGIIGSSANFYTSNELVSSRQDFSWNTYGSFSLSKRRFSMPLSFIVSRYGNQQTSGFSQFGMSPAYKWATLHLGDRYIYFSPFTFQGQSFRGAGIDLKPGIFRFAAFYGRLNKAVNDTSTQQYTTLQYLSKVYGIRIGVGNSHNYFDLMYFHAKDDSTSASFVNITDKAKNDSLRKLVPAKENAVIGASFKLKILKKIYLAGNMAVSGLTQDLGSDAIDSKLLETDLFSHHASVKWLYNTINNKILKLNNSSILSYAGQSSVYFSSRYFNSSLNYRRVEPDFKSLGTPYLANDVELASLFNSLVACKGRLNVSTTLSGQHNNLNKKMNAELQALIGTMNINALMSSHFNINFNCSGYNLVTKNGVTTVPEPDKIKQHISQFNLGPSYNFTKGNTQQFISGNINLSDLQNKNADPLQHVSKTSKNLAASLSYLLGLQNKPLNFSFTSVYNQYKTDVGAYISCGASAGASVQLLKHKNLNVQGNIGCYLNYYSSDVQHNLTYSSHVSYMAKHHAFNLFASCVFTPYNKIQNIINETINNNFPSSVTTKNLAGGISYNYSF